MSSHNAARWITVKWLPARGGRGACPPIIAGWYVVRVCPCHPGTPVTIPLPTEQHAISARNAMLNASKELGT